MDVVTPTKARNNLYAIIADVNRDSKPALIAGADDDKSAYVVGKREYEAQQETMALLLNGQLQDAVAREHDDSVDIDDLIQDLDRENNQ